MEFLEFVHLYVPERKRVYEKLKHSVEKPLNPGEPSFIRSTRNFFHGSKKQAEQTARVELIDNNPFLGKI